MRYNAEIKMFRGTSVIKMKNVTEIVIEDEWNGAYHIYRQYFAKMPIYIDSLAFFGIIRLRNECSYGE